MKKRVTRKLVLNKSILMNLTPDDAAHVAGGSFLDTNCWSCIPICVTNHGCPYTQDLGCVPNTLFTVCDFTCAFYCTYDEYCG